MLESFAVLGKGVAGGGAAVGGRRPRRLRVTEASECPARANGSATILRRAPSPFNLAHGVREAFAADARLEVLRGRVTLALFARSARPAAAGWPRAAADDGRIRRASWAALREVR